MNKRMEEYRALVDAYLASVFPEEGRLYEAMRYSLLAGGKRIRPILTLEFCRVCGGDVQAALPVAGAVEMLHCYSLIHDDLPCMDDDDERRGLPANHIKFGETTAVLAGDCLQAEAFASICRAKIGEAERFRCCSLLAQAAGAEGICGGQMLDLSQPRTEDELLEVDLRKTAALIVCACAMGAAAAGAGGEKLWAAAEFGRSLGMAFQLRDDLLDGDGFCALVGEAECRRMTEAYTQAALKALDSFEDTGFLRALTLALAGREA